MSTDKSNVKFEIKVIACDDDGDSDSDSDTDKEPIGSCRGRTNASGLAVCTFGANALTGVNLNEPLDAVELVLRFLNKKKIGSANLFASAAANGTSSSPDDPAARGRN